MSYDAYLYFFAFTALVLLLYYLTPTKFRWVLLLVASYGYYAIINGFLTLALLTSTVSIFLCGKKIESIQKGFNAVRKELPKEERKIKKEQITNHKKRFVALAVAINFGILLVLKYYNFFATQTNTVAGWFGLQNLLPLLYIGIPLGISYYTLQAVGYVVDVYRGRCPAEHNLAKMALFLGFFPQMTEGPIGRYSDLALQLSTGHKYTNENFTGGATLVLWGFFKKLVISDRASFLANTVFNDYQNYGTPVLILAVLMYTLQLYTDFSACIDIMTGIAKMFGIQLAPNFRQPFFSKSVSEFWRRWHITLGTWFKDYVFYPISLSKPFMKLSKSTQKHCSRFLGAVIPSAVALFFVWFGTGLWHGANEKYILYGLYYFAIMVLGMLFEPLFVKISDKLHINRKGKAMSVIAVARTFILVNIGMMLFRANTLVDFFMMFGQMFTGFDMEAFLNGKVLTLGTDGPDFLVIILGIVIMLIVASLKEKGTDVLSCIANGRILIKWPIMMGLIIAIIVFGAYGPHYSTVASIYADF